MKPAAAAKYLKHSSENDSIFRGPCVICSGSSVDRSVVKRLMWWCSNGDRIRPPRIAIFSRKIVYYSLFLVLNISLVFFVFQKINQIKYSSSGSCSGMGSRGSMGRRSSKGSSSNNNGNNNNNNENNNHTLVYSNVSHYSAGQHTSSIDAAETTSQTLLSRTKIPKVSGRKSYPTFHYSTGGSNQNYTLDNYLTELEKLDGKLYLDTSNVNKHEFRYILNPGNATCGDSDIDLMVYVYSSAPHLGHRTAIRETWGQLGAYGSFGRFRRIFVLGKPGNASLQEAIVKEGGKHGDLLQVDFMDTYRNLTNKGVAALEWVSKFCGRAKFVLKTDDDTFVNLFELLGFLRNLMKKRHPPKRTIFGETRIGSTVKRTGKWSVTQAETARNTYPIFCAGAAYMFTGDMIGTLYEATRHVPFFHLEDVYLTGFVPMNVHNVKHVDVRVTKYRHMGGNFPAWVVKSKHMFICHVARLETFHYIWRNLRPEYLKLDSHRHSKERGPQ